MNDWNSGDDFEFVWRIRQIRKSKLLYGDEREFRQIKETALEKGRTREREFSVVRQSYSTMVEYMGKMLNKMDEDLSLEFYQDANIIAWHAALFIAAINRTNFNSDNDMYLQIFGDAKIKPPNFKRNLTTLSGFSNKARKKEILAETAKKMVWWARAMLSSFVHSTGRTIQAFVK